VRGSAGHTRTECHTLPLGAQVLSAAAVAEFKVGSAERGRAIFEDVLRNYPKRTDLWSVYLDQARSPGLTLT
jgi:hypothetical protein